MITISIKISIQTCQLCQLYVLEGKPDWQIQEVAPDNAPISNEINQSTNTQQ